MYCKNQPEVVSDLKKNEFFNYIPLICPLYLLLNNIFASLRFLKLTWLPPALIVQKTGIISAKPAIKNIWLSTYWQGYIFFKLLWGWGGAGDGSVASTLLCLKDGVVALDNKKNKMQEANIKRGKGKRSKMFLKRGKRLKTLHSCALGIFIRW